MVEAERQGRDVYDLVNEAVQEIKPGSDRLIYLPYLMGEGTPHLDPDCRGVFSDCRPSIRKAIFKSRHGRSCVFALRLQQNSWGYGCENPQR